MTADARFPIERLEAYRPARKALDIIVARSGQLEGLPGAADQGLEWSVVAAFAELCAGSAHDDCDHYREALSAAEEAAAYLDDALVYRPACCIDFVELRSTLLELCAALRDLIERCEPSMMPEAQA
jgi:hypothetical protein